MLERWLRCWVYKGMFSDERAIRYVRSTDLPVSVFVPKDTVQGDIDHEGKVKVNVFRQGGTAWAVLPSEQEMVIPVDETDLIAL